MYSYALRMMGIQGGKVTICVLCKAVEDVGAHNIVDSLLIAGGGGGLVGVDPHV